MDGRGQGRADLVRPILSGLLELSGVGAITYGCFLLSPVVGAIVGGLLLVLVGLAVDPPARRVPEVKE